MLLFFVRPSEKDWILAALCLREGGRGGGQGM